MDFNKYEDFERGLKERYPSMFTNLWGGVSVGEGWWPIIESLCYQIHSHVTWKNEQRDQHNRGEGCPEVSVEQVKEKFGGLRFYYSGGNDVIDGMVRMAESWAAHSCETCGKPGERRGGGWIRTLCDEHEAEYQARTKERSGS